jgi:hypothetical protein
MARRLQARSKPQQLPTMSSALTAPCPSTAATPPKGSASLVLLILPISKEGSPASILSRVWCDMSSRTCLAGLGVLLHKEICFCFTLVCRVSPGFTVTGSISIRQPPLTLPADKVTKGDISLGLMQTPLRSRLSRMPHGRQIKEKKVLLRQKEEIKVKAGLNAALSFASKLGPYTHTWTEGRVPLWGSELTTIAAALQGGVQQKSCPAFVCVGLGPVVTRARV